MEITASSPSSCKLEQITVIYLQDQICWLCRSKFSVTQLMLRSLCPRSTHFRVGLVQPAPSPGYFMSSQSLPYFHCK